MAPSKGCLPAAVKLLAARDHSEQDLRRKLRRSYGEAEIEEAVSVLRTRGYLDDAALARRLAARYIEEGQYGRLGIRARLGKQGLPSAAVDAALTGFSDASEYAPAAALVNRRFPRKTPADAPKAGRFLAVRGFSAETIMTVLGRIFDYREDV
jgi:regulatory protein